MQWKVLEFRTFQIDDLLNHFYVKVTVEVYQLSSLLDCVGRKIPENVLLNVEIVEIYQFTL